MRISIITATYNSSKTIRDTLDSVKVQTHPDIEHLIIDGLSKDNTLEIVKGYPHVSKIISEKDNGIYDAMNKGVRATTGEIVGILNSDDVYINNGVLNKVAKAFEDEDTDAVYGDLKYVQQNDLSKTTRTWRTGTFSKNKFYYGWMPPHPSFFVRKRVYDKVGLFNTELRSSADYEFMLRVLLKHNHKVKYIPEVLVKMRTGGMSNATLNNRLRANQEDRKAWELNGLKPYFFTIPLKPLRKIFQFISK